MKQTHKHGNQILALNFYTSNLLTPANFIIINHISRYCIMQNKCKFIYDWKREIIFGERLINADMPIVGGSKI